MSDGMWFALLWLGACPVAALVCEVEDVAAHWWRSTNPSDPQPFWRLLRP